MSAGGGTEAPTKGLHTGNTTKAETRKETELKSDMAQGIKHKTQGLCTFFVFSKVKQLWGSPGPALCRGSISK